MRINKLRDLRTSRSTKVAGTEVGLSIARKAVERMGGTIGVESAPGAGARFWIELAPVGVNGAVPLHVKSGSS